MGKRKFPKENPLIRFGVAFMFVIKVIFARGIGSHTAAAGAISNRKTASRKFTFDSFHKRFSFVCNEYLAHTCRQQLTGKNRRAAAPAVKKHVRFSFLVKNLARTFSSLRC